MMQTSSVKPVRLGFVGVGPRGVYHLKNAIAIPGVEPAALCDVNEARLQEAAAIARAVGRAAPRLYSKGPTDYDRMCAEETLDAVICSTPAQTHAAVCLAANRNGKHAAAEAPLALTLEDTWSLVDVFEKTKKWSATALQETLLDGENGANLSLLHLVRNGLLGEMIHCEDGVLRRGRAGRDMNPDPPMNRLLPLMNINRGDRFDFMMSASSARGYNASIIHTAKGNLVTLNYDVTGPNPAGYCRLQGTKGVYMSGPGLPGPMIYIDGITPTPHRWEKVDPYFARYPHPLRAQAGNVPSPLTWRLLVKALREGTDPVFDIYDSATSSAIIGFSRQSAANRSKPVQFPDFTRGRWKERQSVNLISA
jgi:hypothetical protein